VDWDTIKVLVEKDNYRFIGILKWQIMRHKYSKGDT
jgi:hypothetical protein